MSDLEVLAGKLMRKTEKRLILCSGLCERVPGPGEVSREELTRSRWLSALSFVVVSSAMFPELEAGIRESKVSLRKSSRGVIWDRVSRER